MVNKKIYLDYAATTPVDSEVKKTMLPYFSEKFGNAGSLHSFGQEATAAIDGAREKIAKAIGAQFREIIFTGSATEANNLALRGVLKAKSLKVKARIIVSAIEHESVLETAKDLEREGAEVIYLPVNREGLVDVGKLKESLNERTILVSVMYVNNEIGTVQPVREISKLILEFRKHSTFPLFHTDAAQALQYLDCDINNLGVDLMTLSAHKIYGPKGIGVLYAKSLKLKAIITGGGQEFGFRSGTENTPLIVGFGKAVELAARDRKRAAKKITELRDYFWKELKKIEPKIEVNGRIAPHILNIYFPYRGSQDFLARLDLSGISASSGSACFARSLVPSYVIQALGYSRERAEHSVRFSFGKYIGKKDIDEALKRVKIIVDNS
ncbi:hypothetical protein A3A20_02885 [Candidatus Wolfebacteria bacterium RIFCSPLOWO2_01_FULL_45_19]|uniref:cysteine desulfurase n=1 Tax=Candidatus Wolfebacteria bacterium RIFCSPLOWO2_01_FULL_45_19 TaxID=1802557 RepID=A0A1F8DS82_9BACT|nr:MAG: Cysteine desulfurase [Parcubacteria group bacterium GW2011_GWB1_45_9]OGM91487.1 MAG: hypothetical protein A3A20_02885 [Candidatus Wolfebacteria bacterium RIFCSPLOWO2_01_FULL_45_19]